MATENHYSQIFNPAIMQTLPLVSNYWTIYESVSMLILVLPCQESHVRQA